MSARACASPCLHVASDTIHGSADCGLDSSAGSTVRSVCYRPDLALSVLAEEDACNRQSVCVGCSKRLDPTIRLVRNGGSVIEMFLN